MQLKDIKKGDIVTNRRGAINIVNKPNNYMKWFDNDFKNKEIKHLDIMKIERHVKFLWFCKLKTIYKRKEKN